ncbi:MAG: ribonuclease E/G [Alphaproteobacteria bacterium]|nr:ribonuclease E/G [Alphaproteobacteria bacterium]
MTRLIISAHEALLCAACDGEAGISDLYAARRDAPDDVGAVVSAKVVQTLPGQGAAIVRWAQAGADREGYWNDAAAKNAKAGDVLRLQIKAAAQGAKLPQLKRDIALPGRFLIHLPAGKGIKFSRQQEGASEAPPLQDLRGGWVVRRAAAGVAAALLRQEAEALAALGVQDAQQEEIAAPTVWQRALVESGENLRTILVADAALERAVGAWLNVFAPDLLGGLTVQPDALDWDSLFAEATAPTLSLNGGGSITVERTRAAWVADIDAGAAQYHLAVNLAAVTVLARQMRLRNLTGILLADFISLPNVRDQQQLLKALRAAVATDPAGVEVFGLTKLGLVEMTRTRRGQSLDEITRF